MNALTSFTRATIYLWYLKYLSMDVLKDLMGHRMKRIRAFWAIKLTVNIMQLIYEGIENA